MFIQWKWFYITILSLSHLCEAFFFFLIFSKSYFHLNKFSRKKKIMYRMLKWGFVGDVSFCWISNYGKKFKEFSLQHATKWNHFSYKKYIFIYIYIANIHNVISCLWETFKILLINFLSCFFSHCTCSLDIWIHT